MEDGGDELSEELKEASGQLQEIYNEASRLRDKFFADVARYKKDSRITTISLMKMLVELERMNLQRDQFVHGVRRRLAQNSEV